MGDETAEELNCSSSWPLLHTRCVRPPFRFRGEGSICRSRCGPATRWTLRRRRRRSVSGRPARPLTPAAIPPRPTPDLLFLPPPLFSATLVNLVGTTLPPDLVPRIEEQQRVPSYPSVMAGVQLRRIADDFARRRPPNGRRRSFPLSFFRFD
ncbi:hypothetical protein MRX96_021337 [Rhipicephalus microplus]